MDNRNSLRRETEVYTTRPFLTRVDTTEVQSIDHALVEVPTTRWICEHAHWHRDRDDADRCNLIPFGGATDGQ